MDIVIDNSVMHLFGPKCPAHYRDLFSWVADEGTLVISHFLLKEYIGSNPIHVGALIDKISRRGGLDKKPPPTVDAFDTGHFAFTCNFKDTRHAKLVFISLRKKLVAKDGPLLRDVNNYPLVDGIKPVGVDVPAPAFYR